MHQIQSIKKNELLRITEKERMYGVCDKKRRDEREGNKQKRSNPTLIFAEVSSIIIELVVDGELMMHNEL